MTSNTDEVRPSPDIFTAIQSGPIDVNQWLARAQNTQFGATTMFLGTVRDHDPETGDLRVAGIEYSAHPGATEILRKEMADLLQEKMTTETPAGETPAGETTAAVPLSVIAIHRVGQIMVGEAALLVIVSGAHRYPSMDLIPEIVERIKQTLPMWKKQLLEDGSSAWSNLP